MIIRMLPWLVWVGVSACAWDRSPTPYDTAEPVFAEVADPLPPPPGWPPAWWPLWLYHTCGDPVCTGHVSTGQRPCGPHEAGDPCRKPNAQCDPIDFCNRRLVCTDEDPMLQPGGCPISRATYKKNIRYLEREEIDRVSHHLMNFKLATWSYRAEGDDGRANFGFIIDDVVESADGAMAVAADGNHVDLYGYTSMAVAALQAQSREIAVLRAEIEALRQDLGIRPNDANAPNEFVDP